MLATLVNLFQSEAFVQIFALGSVVLLFALTYIFGFKSNDSTNENNQEKQQSAPRQLPAVVNKPKRLSKTQQETTVNSVSISAPPASVTATPKQNKKAQKQPKKTAKQEATKQLSATVRLDKEEARSDENNEESNGEWITVKDKKQKKSQSVEDKPQPTQKQVPKEKSEKVKPQSSTETSAPPVVLADIEDNNWTKVKEKKTEKKKVQPASVPVSEQVAKNLVSVNVVQDVPVPPITDDNNWITVKEKKTKKNSITKLISEPVHAVVPPAQQQQQSQLIQSTKPVSETPVQTEVPVEPLVEAVTNVPLPSPKKKNKIKSAKTIDSPSITPIVESTSNVSISPKQQEQAASVQISTPQEEIPTGSKLDLLTSSLSEINSDENKNEPEWIQANSKTIKKSNKTKVQPVATASAVKQVEPLSPQSKKKQSTNQLPTKQSISATKPSSLLLPINTEVVLSSAQPQSEVVFRNQVSTPDAIAAAIVDNTTGNNQIKTNNRKSTGNSETNAQTTTNNNKKSKPAVNMSHLKQTNLSDSMILIDSTITSSNDDANFNQILSSSLKNSSRTNSNQSSSESIQDLDVDGEDGWATITSKKSKRTTVRREQ